MFFFVCLFFFTFLRFMIKLKFKLFKLELIKHGCMPKKVNGSELAGATEQFMYFNVSQIFPKCFFFFFFKQSKGFWT